MIDYSSVLTILVYVIVGLFGGIERLQMVSCICAIALIVFLWCKDRLLRAAPLFLFFNSSILYFMGFAITDLFFSVFIINEVMKRPYIRISRIPVMLLIFLVYSICVVSGYGSSMLFIRFLLIFLFLIFLLQKVSTQKEWELFTAWYIVGLLAASVYGVSTLPVSIQSGLSRRLILAFTDPNYAGMFLSIGLYITAFCEKLPKITKIALCGFILFEILMTMSTTAILCNLFVFLSILAEKACEAFREKKIKNGARLITAIIVLAFAALFSEQILTGLKGTTIGDSFFRFINKVKIASGNLNEATTGRSSIWKKHLDIFWNGSFPSFLFGGHFITDYGVDTRLFSIVSHQVYVDSLLCFGLLGTVVYVGSIARQLVVKFLNRNHSSTNRQLFCIVLIWVFYSFGLSMFPFWGFLFMLFVNPNREGIEVAG